MAIQGKIYKDKPSDQKLMQLFQYSFIFKKLEMITQYPFIFYISSFSSSFFYWYNAKSKNVKTGEKEKEAKVRNNEQNGQLLLGN